MFCEILSNLDIQHLQNLMQNRIKSQVYILHSKYYETESETYFASDIQNASFTTMFFFFFLFSSPPGYIATLFSGAGVVSRTMHPAVWDTHMSSPQCAQSVDCRSVQAYETPNSCGEGLLGNLFGVRLIPTGYSLYAIRSCRDSNPDPHNQP